MQQNLSALDSKVWMYNWMVRAFLDQFCVGKYWLQAVRVAYSVSLKIN